MFPVPTRLPRRSAGLLGALLVLNSCYTWNTPPGMTAVAVVAEGPERIRVHRWGDQETVVLHKPRVVADTVIGLAGPWRALATVTIPLDEVASVQTRSLDPGNSIATVVGVTLATLSVIVVITLASLDCFIDCQW